MNSGVFTTDRTLTSAGGYFPGDHPVLRDALDGYLRSLGERLGGQAFSGEVAALLLAGGYGRGEGGVFFKEGTACLYNDLEFYLVLNSSSVAGEARGWCAEESHRGEEETGIEVEFKILSFAALRSAEPSMFYYDLLSANICVFGDASLAERLPPALRDGGLLPGHEATRLLFNRGTGLLFSRQALEEDSGRVRDGFVERNHAKARLAMADAVLALNGRYHFSCIRRAERLLESLPDVPPNWRQLVAWHGEAVEFKFHPQHEHPSRSALLGRQEELVAAWNEVFLWLESRRLGGDFSDAAAYAVYGGRLFPGSNPARNILLHLRDRSGGDRGSRFARGRIIPARRCKEAWPFYCWRIRKRDRARAGFSVFRRGPTWSGSAPATLNTGGITTDRPW